MNRVSYMKEYNRLYYQKNKSREKERANNFRLRNPDIVKRLRVSWYQKYGSEYRLKNLDKMRKTAREWARKNKKPYCWNEGKKISQQKYRAKHKDKIAEKRRIAFRKRLGNDENFRLRWLLRSRMITALKRQLSSKSYKTIELLGCKIDVARKHIEKQFKEGMSWENHGEWEIDHIIPVSSFDLTRSEEQKKAFHYTNLQPLSRLENRKKKDKVMI